MFVFYSVHYPHPEKQALGAQVMRQFDKLIKKQPGIVFASDIFADPAKGTLIVPLALALLVLPSLLGMASQGRPRAQKEASVL